MAQNSQYAEKHLQKIFFFFLIVASKQKTATRENMPYKTLFLLAESLVSKGNYINYYNI